MSWTLQLRVMAVLSATELALSRSIWPSPTDEEVFSGVMSRVLRSLVQQGSDLASITKGGSNRVFILLEMNRNLKVGATHDRCWVLGWCDPCWIS